MKIDYVSTRFPDALVRIREHGNWVTHGVEFELNARGFCTHFKSKMSKQRMEGNKYQRCDLIICWKNDMPDAAKEELKLITESRKKNGVKFPIKIRALREDLIQEKSK